nr:zinc finger, PHD-type, conserved site [Tanacetum cinerariifolium]
AAFDASKEVVWVRKFISGLSVVPTIEEPIIILQIIGGGGGLIGAVVKRGWQRMRGRRRGCLDSVAHFLHPAHKLTELNDATSYLCDGCKVVGDGTRFSCVSCQFDLHAYCAKCPTRLTSTTNHPHPMSLVVYKPKPNQTEPCQICRKPILGLVYECKSCSFLVHPLCVSRNSRLNQGSAIPTSSSTTQGIGEQIAVGLATNYIYDTITKDEDEVPTADSDALGNDEEPTADSDDLGNDEESGSFFHGFKSVIVSIFSSSSS